VAFSRNSTFSTIITAVFRLCRSVLGLNAVHAASSAALLRDGRLIAAAEEERFRRIKHWAGFPSQAVAYCLRDAGLLLSDVEHIAFNQDSRANLVRKIAYFPTKRPDVSLVLSRIRNRRARASLPVLLEQAFPGQKIHTELHSVEHHLAHLSSAFHVCPFEQAAVVSIAGFRRFLQRDLGCGGVRNLALRSSIFSAFAWHLLSGGHTVSRLSALWRRIQDDGTRTLRPTLIPRAARKIVHLLPDGGFELDRKFFRLSAPPTVYPSIHRTT
jgi:carbamoyltransferase